MLRFYGLKVTNSPSQGQLLQKPHPHLPEGSQGTRENRAELSFSKLCVPRIGSLVCVLLFLSPPTPSGADLAPQGPRRGWEGVGSLPRGFCPMVKSAEGAAPGPYGMN